MIFLKLQIPNKNQIIKNKLFTHTQSFEINVPYTKNSVCIPLQLNLLLSDVHFRNKEISYTFSVELCLNFLRKLYWNLESCCEIMSVFLCQPGPLFKKESYFCNRVTYINMELVSNISESVPISIIRGDMMSATSLHCIYTSVCSQLSQHM
jgi:hypothetical protein